MNFKWEINIGNVIEIFTFLFVVLNGARKLGVLETRINIVYEWFEGQIINRQELRKSKANSGD